jgi:GT2 family glycosyltransferase
MSQPTDITVVIPVFNQLHYTSQCVDSLNRAGVADAQIIIVNNGSTDGTQKFLTDRPQIQAIHNAKNLGCGPAWTQGAKASQTTWTIVINNDVLVPPGFVSGLVGFANKKKHDIVSPAMREGELDYDLTSFAAEFTDRMASAFRGDTAHGVCFMVHRRVFASIGYFADGTKLGGYEDDEFFRRAKATGFRLAITGRAFLHHFGSITQKSLKSELSNNGHLGDRDYYRQKTGQTWSKRKATQFRNSLRAFWWHHSERLFYGRKLME